MVLVSTSLSDQGLDDRQRKARVFPVPVLALARRSLFSSKIVLNVAAWMGNRTFTPRACKACLVTDESEKSPNALLPSGAVAGLLRRLVLGVDGPRARPRVRLHAGVERILGLGFLFLLRGFVVFDRLAFFSSSSSSRGRARRRPLISSSRPCARPCARPWPWPWRCRCRRCPWCLLFVLALAGFALSCCCAG